MSSNPHRVLFVCMGNICRSPAGEGIFRHYVEERGAEDQFVIDSAGTIGYHAGASADARMRAAAARRGYDLDSISRKFVPADFDRFDLILAMDGDNLRDILCQDPGGKYADRVKLFCEFVPGGDYDDVPDPYYGGDQGFERVIDLIEAGCGPIFEYFMNGETRE